MWMQPSDFPQKENPTPRQTEVGWRKNSVSAISASVKPLSCDRQPQMLCRSVA